jgi:hypothetical protein
LYSTTFVKHEREKECDCDGETLAHYLVDAADSDGGEKRHPSYSSTLPASFGIVAA